MLQERVGVQMCLLEAVLHWLLLTDFSTRLVSWNMMEQKVSSQTFFLNIPKSHHLLFHLTRLKTDIIISLLDLLLGTRTQTQEDCIVQQSSCIIQLLVAAGHVYVSAPSGRTQDFQVHGLSSLCWWLLQQAIGTQLWGITVLCPEIIKTLWDLPDKRDVVCWTITT